MGRLSRVIQERSPETKLATFLIIALASFNASGAGLAALSCVMILHYAAIRPARREIATDAKLLAGFLIMYTIFLCIDPARPGWFVPESLLDAIRRFSRVSVAYAASRIFYANSKPSEIRSSLERIPRPFGRKGGIRIATRIAQVFCSVPFVLRYWDEGYLAFRARAGFSRKRGLAPYICLITGFLRRILVVSVDLSDAEFARDAGSARALAPFRFDAKDAAYLSYAVALAAITILFR